MQVRVHAGFSTIGVEINAATTPPPDAYLIRLRRDGALVATHESTTAILVLSVQEAGAYTVEVEAGGERAISESVTLEPIQLPS